ncbi:MAG: hypothetical protein AAFX93_20540 [Verrucomicrobiota bacterium]
MPRNPVANKAKKISVSLPESLENDLREHAENNETTVSKITQTAIAQYLNDSDKIPSQNDSKAVEAIAETFATAHDADQIKQWCERNGIEDQRQIVQLLIRGLWRSTETISSEQLDEVWTVAPKSSQGAPKAKKAYKRMDPTHAANIRKKVEGDAKKRAAKKAG